MTGHVSTFVHESERRKLSCPCGIGRSYAWRQLCYVLDKIKDVVGKSNPHGLAQYKAIFTLWRNIAKCGGKRGVGDELMSLKG